MVTSQNQSRISMESSRVEEEKYDRLIVVKLIDAAVDNIADYSMWLDRLIEEVEQQNPQIHSKRYELFKDETRFDIINTQIWDADFDKVKQEMLKTDEYKKKVDQLTNEMHDNVNKVKEITRQIDVSKKYKMSAEKKIRDLHAKANKLPILELEIKNLEDKLLRAEKSRDIVVEKLKEKQTKELRERTTTEGSMIRPGAESFGHLHRDPNMSTDKPLGYTKTNTFRQMADNVVDVEYDFKTKTEMKSLKDLVRFLNKELVSQRNKNLNHRLFNFKKKAPNFERLTQMYSSGVKLSRSGIDTIKNQKLSKAAQPNLNTLLESALKDDKQLKVLVEESEEESINEGNPSLTHSQQGSAHFLHFPQAPGPPIHRVQHFRNQEIDLQSRSTRYRESQGLRRSKENSHSGNLRRGRQVQPADSNKCPAEESPGRVQNDPQESLQAQKDWRQESAPCQRFLRFEEEAQQAGHQGLGQDRFQEDSRLSFPDHFEERHCFEESRRHDCLTSSC